MPVLHLLFLLLSLITISFLHCPITATSHSVPEYHALLALKSSITSDPSSSLQPWSSSTHHCSWPFITFDPTTLSITAIDLTNLNLTGSIPLSIRHLPNLANLSLAVNSFSDNIPPDVAHLSNLRYLNLSNNVFNGSLPSNLSLLQNLQILDLYNNNLIEALPADLAGIPVLRHLHLGGSFFSSSIPSEYGQLPALEYRTPGVTITSTVPSVLLPFPHVRSAIHSRRVSHQLNSSNCKGCRVGANMK
ncbi:Serine/threonine protein kinase [Cinnamomum micranthum f. kanehirae]|uniref:Serine/threonine protein kinase n=1 Tax=Cinnamomum micranthum f. kanehirae TaxID=337451 RepID=A0A3S3MEH6_9MAGN|nr:Serine/threonine protein kinase [Cinnamomum micranthum f. kanehirae]